MAQNTITDFIDELEWRGLLKDCTDTDGLRAHLNDPGGSPRKAYAGFDPTADSLTIGNLVPIMVLAHFKRAGHHPVVLMGGGTGLIGDPSGKSAERQLRTREDIEGYINKQRPIYAAVLGDEGKDFTIVNNADWLCELSYIDALRDIGKHFSVNMMMQKESVRERLNNREQGISYTEFSYMILQSYDFAHLYENDGITVQLGGSDQYGNIVAGTDLIRRYRAETMEQLVSAFKELTPESNLPKYERDGKSFTIYDMYDSLLSTDTESSHEQAKSMFLHQLDSIVDQLPDERSQKHLELAKTVEEVKRSLNPSFGLTAPLVQKADGGKFGKTESGAIWLTAERTSPYAYYQFWLNCSDEDVPNFLRTFTFLSREEVEAIESAHAAEPGRREAQRRLAQEATKILHGEDAMHQAEAAGKALFSGEIAGLDEKTLTEVFASVPSSEHAKSDLGSDGGVDPLALLKEIGAVSSNREGREFLSNGSVSVNGVKIGLEDRLNESHLLHGSLIAIRRGKKKWYLTRWA